MKALSTVRSDDPIGTRTRTRAPNVSANKRSLCIVQFRIPPRPRTERLMNFPLLLRAYVFLGLIEAGVAMGAFFLLLLTQGWTWGTPLDWSDPLYKQATTATFAAIVVAQVANVFACRSDRVPLSQLGWLTNPLILWGIASELIVLTFIIYTPWGNAIFGTSPLPAWIFGPLALGALTLLFAEEGRKFIVSRFTSSRAGGITQQTGTS